VTLAMANFYPDPKPDLSVLPHGTRGDVVIDIVIDEDGKVVDTKVDQGLGHGCGRGGAGGDPDLDLLARDQGRQAGGERAATSVPLRTRLGRANIPQGLKPMIFWFS
jgi:hypothetical protein